MQSRIPRPTVIAAGIVALTLTTLAGVLLSALWYEVFDRGEPGRILVSVVAVAAIMVTYGRLMWLNLTRRMTSRHRLWLAALAAACLAMPLLLPVPHGQPGWSNAVAVPAGLIAIVLPIRQAVAVAVSASALVPVYLALLGLPTLTLFYQGIFVPAAALSGYVTVWLLHVVQELREVRAELARSAVGEERLRFARDLHDVLGHSLQAVALRAEVAERYLDRDPGRVRKELVEIQRMARDSVQDVREIVRGYRATSLHTELAGMSAVLSAAGIQCRTPEISPDLPPHVHEPLGWVTREAATNVLRHSSASWCLITVWADDGRVWLEITNDGAGRRTGRDPGSGLAGLTERMEAAGGEFSAGPVGDGTFRLAAALPMTTSERTS